MMFRISTTLCVLFAQAQISLLNAQIIRISYGTIPALGSENVVSLPKESFLSLKFHQEKLITSYVFDGSPNRPYFYQDDAFESADYKPFDYQDRHDPLSIRLYLKKEVYDQCIAKRHVIYRAKGEDQKYYEMEVDAMLLTNGARFDKYEDGLLVDRKNHQVINNFSWTLGSIGEDGLLLKKLNSKVGSKGLLPTLKAYLQNRTDKLIDQLFDLKFRRHEFNAAYSSKSGSGMFVEKDAWTDEEATLSLKLKCYTKAIENLNYLSEKVNDDTRILVENRHFAIFLLNQPKEYQPGELFAIRIGKTTFENFGEEF